MTTPTDPTRTAVLVTASETEPRTFGKQVVLGGLLDHLVDRLGPDAVHVVLVGRPDAARPAVPYRRHLLAKPTAGEQGRALLTRVLAPPHTSLQEAALWSPRLGRELAALLRGIDADLEIWDTVRLGQYAVAAPTPRPRRRVLYADDLFSNRYATVLAQARADRSVLREPLGQFAGQLPRPVRRLAAVPEVSRLLLGLERRLVAGSEDAAPAHFDTTVLVNPEETAELRRRSGVAGVSTLLPLIAPAGAGRRQHPGTPRFAFLGSLDFAPNRDGLRWFLDTCREEVLTALPGFELLLVGRGSDVPLPEARPWGDHVRPLGWVDDLDQVLSSVAALVSPLRTGSGIKIKVLEALARGVPVVATPLGVLGLGVGRADGCLVAEDPATLARALAEAADPARNRALSVAARTAWASRFCPDVARPAYDRVLGLPQLVAGRGR